VFVLDELEILRQEIDEVDDMLVKLFIERMAIAQKMGEYKSGRNMKIYDPAREKEIIERFVNGVRVDFDTKYIEQFLKNLISLSRGLQEDMAGRKMGPR